MPTRLLLEGGDLQELLAQVREEHGTRAKIVSAERVRAGGLTGLLRAERYELTVELSDDEPAEAPVPVGVAPGAAGSPAPPPPARAAQAVAGGQTHGTPSAAGPAQRPAARPAAPGAVPVANAAPSAGAMSGGTPTGGAVNGLAAGGAPGNGMAPIGPAGSGMTAQGAAGNGLAAYNGAAGNGMTAYGAVGNGITGNGMATHGTAGNGMAGNSGRPAAGPAGRQANAPAIGGRPAGEHGPDVDELLALLEQREAATPVSSSVGGPTAADEVPGSPPAGFDAVLAELRGAGGAAANGAAANGTANGTANATPNGMPNGAASATPDGAANATPDGVSNGTPHGGANASAGTAHGPAAGQVAPPQQAQSAHSTSPHVQSAQTPPSAIHSAIENALPAVLRQESTPVSAETVEFAMDPIFAPAKGAPEAPPAPAAARATIPAPGTTARPGAGHTPTGHTQTGHNATGHAQTGQPPAPTQTSPAQAGPAHSGAGAQNGSAHGTSAQNSASRATSARSTANPGRTRPLSPDPRRPNHFLSYGELESIPSEHPLPQKLVDLGLPQRVIDRLPLGEAYPSIVRALLDEPDAPPLPSGPGTIITIIGELAGALAVAEDIARILRLDADRILIASESPQVGRHIADPGDAGRQAARLRGGDQPRLVCVDAPVPTSWVQQVVIALRPDAVWCAVDATRKPADVARQLRSLPRVDALAVHQLEATADPASPLALGVPVALLDGQPAGPHGWAALLSRRLFEEEFSGGDR